MSFYRRIILLVLSSSLFIFNTAWAASVQKLGYIDTLRVYQESQQAQVIQKSLQKEFSARQDALQQLQQKIVTLKKALDDSHSKKEQETLSKSLSDLDRRFRVESAALLEDYNLRRAEEFASLQNRANQVIRELARQEGYDLILQDAVYVNKKFDITDKIIQILNNSNHQ